MNLPYDTEAQVAERRALEVALRAKRPHLPHFVHLTSGVGRQNTPVIVQPCCITGMTIEPGNGTVLYMSGGKHLVVRESPEEIFAAFAK